MIDVKQAVRTAISYVKDLYAGGDVSLRDVALEEVSLSDDDGEWVVTVGFEAIGDTRVASRASGLFPTHASIERVPRDYKQLRIDAETGRVKSMLRRAI